MSAVTIERPAKEAVLNRQKMRQGVSSAIRLSRRIFTGLYRKEVAVTVGLVVVLIASAIGVIVSAHQNRQLFNTLSELHAERDALQRQWSQLLLEQSALSAHSHIERRIAEQHTMVVPGRDSIVLVPGVSESVALIK
ncbi:cell division protein FtsL [Marinobacter salicampi]|uniref:cell division protein FtsL n=1 Tax=Marinobacter salicampi TaxID=435907 RepID=UPI0014076756|nr:cell division protein FtsL [Marinobacter salicampi]